MLRPGTTKVGPLESSSQARGAGAGSFRWRGSTPLSDQRRHFIAMKVPSSTSDQLAAERVERRGSRPLVEVSVA